MKEEQQPQKTLVCPLCGEREFKKDTVVLAKYGFLRLTDYKVVAFICKKCHHIVLFESGDTFFLGVD